MEEYHPFSLSGKRLLITGASSGIGRASAIACSRMGAILTLTGRHEARLKETLEQTEEPARHQILAAELTDEAQLKKLTDGIAEPLDGVVHCAGISMARPVKFLTGELMDQMMNTNYKAPVLLTQQLLKNRKVNRGASIIFISSVLGVFVSEPATGMYSGTKAALTGMAKAMALELAPRGIRVNCICPGVIKTELFENSGISQEQLDENLKRYPLGRYGRPEEVAQAAIYLLSDASTWITGTILKIDGGLTLL